MQIDKELGTPVDDGPRWVGFWVGIFLMILLSVPVARNLGLGDEKSGGESNLWTPFFQSVIEILQHEALFNPIAANQRLQIVIDQLERGLELNSPILKATRPRVQEVMTRWGGIGNTQVILGKDGWMFYRPGFDYTVGQGFLRETALENRRRGGPSWRRAAAADPRPAILDLKRQLKERGIPLLFLVVPTKVMIHGEVLGVPSGYQEQDFPDLHNPSFRSFRQDLEGAGVWVLDTTQTIREIRADGHDAFLKTDSHWSPEAVDGVAKILADHIEVLDLAFEAPRRAWRENLETLTSEGDLAQLLELPDNRRETEEIDLHKVFSFDGRPWQADPEAEILLLGDSFSNVFSVADLGWGAAAGLGERLSVHLGRSIDRIAVNDGSATACRERWATSLAAKERNLDSLKLVIYQVAVRELSAGDWQLVSLEGSY